MKEKRMPKKMFDYKCFNGSRDIWYTDSLKGWFIVKEENIYVLRKGSFVNDTIEFATKKYNTYKRLGDAKTGLENLLKDHTKTIVNQQILFDKLKAEYEKEKRNQAIDYSELDKQAEILKAKWGLI